MRFIEIDFDGLVVRARLNEEKAPKTSQMIWDALPFGGRAVHAQLSGEMFRMLDPSPVDDVDVEGGEVHQYPGEVVYYPPLKEIAFCYGEAQFRGQSGALFLTPLADIEGDFSQWAERADRLPWDGARPIEFRRAADQETPFRYPDHKGRKLEIQFGDAQLQATLLESLAPQTVGAFLDTLPLEGTAVNDDWGGYLTRLDGASGGAVLQVDDRESLKRQVWPGYIYYDHELHRIYMCYGDASVGDITRIRSVTPIAVLDGDWGEYRKRAIEQLTAGAVEVVIRPAT